MSLLPCFVGVHASHYDNKNLKFKNIKTKTQNKKELLLSALDTCLPICVGGQLSHFMVGFNLFIATILG